jgi:vitamin B12 transporter
MSPSTRFSRCVRARCALASAGSLSHRSFLSRAQFHRFNYRFKISSIGAALYLASAGAALAEQADGSADVVVSASRTAQVATQALPHTTVIDRDAIERSPASDLVALLQMQTGVSVSSSGAQGALMGVRIRGGEPRHTLVLLDGVPMNALSSGVPDLQALALANVERVEIVRGNVSALYGSQAVGGLVQIFTRKVTGNEASVRVAGGTHGQLQTSVQVSAGNDKVQATVGISHEQVKAVSAQKPEQTAQVGSQWSAPTSANPDKDAYRNNAANAHVRYRPNERHEFGVRLMHSDGKSDYDNAYSPSLTAIQYGNIRLQSVGLYANNQWNDVWRSAFTLSQYTDKSDDFDSAPGFGDGRSSFKTTTEQAAWQHTIDSRYGQWIAGASRMQQKLSSDTVYDNTQRNTNSAWLGYNLDAGAQHLQVNARYDGLTGMKAEYTGALHYGYDVADGLRVFGSYSNGFSAPNFNELYYPNYSNPNLQPEHANYAELGAQYASDHAGARFTLFETRYRDKIGLDKMTYLPMNIHRAKARGLEWRGWYQFNGWTLDAGWTYQTVKDCATDAQLLRQPKFLANLAIGRTWGKWSGSANWQVQSGSDDVGSQRVAGYGVLNLAAQYALRPNLTVGLTVGNLFGRDYQTIYGYNAMPRNALLSLAYKPKW